MELLRVLLANSKGGRERALFAMLAVSFVFVGDAGRANHVHAAPTVSVSSKEFAGERPVGLHACPSEAMSCYPGCARIGEIYACGAQLIAVAGGLAGAIIAVAEADGVSIEDFCEKHTILCSKGGVQNKENEYVREAKLRPDPCEWLQDRYDESTGDEREKIRLAQKFLGCRNKQKRKK